MHSLIVIGVCLAGAAADEPPVAVNRLYHGVGREVWVTVNPPPGARQVALTLLEADGSVVAPARKSRRGPVDLAEALPEIWTIRRTCYLQCLADGEPSGSALVVQPMLWRLEPRTETSARPDGTTYTRIVGWGPRPPRKDPGPPPPPPPGQPAAAPTAEGLEDAGESGGRSRAGQAAAPGEPVRVFSGLRIYPERDVVLHTSKGDIVVALRPDEAPNTAWNFRHLVQGGFYDGVIFHRVVPYTRAREPFVIQAGDPTGGGEGGPGYRLPLEPSGLPHDFGVISMARADHPDSAGSQFFICLSRAGTARLDGQYCAFGYAVGGAETIRAIAAVELAHVASGRPVDPPVIRRAVLIPSPPRVPGVGRPDQPVAEQQESAAETQPDRVPR